jgi:hypothetical protein
MNVLRCARARLGFGANKNRKKRQCPPRSISDLSRLVAAHRLVIVSIILPGKEFHRLAHEFETRAEQLECSTPPPSQAGWWLTRRDQARGSEGDH